MISLSAAETSVTFPVSATFLLANTISPSTEALIAFNWATLYVPFTVTVALYPVIPFKASLKSFAFPDKSCALFTVNAPSTIEFIYFKSANV